MRLSKVDPFSAKQTSGKCCENVSSSTGVPVCHIFVPLAHISALLCCSALVLSCKHAPELFFFLWRLLPQARVTDLKSCVVVLRIFRDMCNRLPEWQPLKGWVGQAGWCLWLRILTFSVVALTLCPLCLSSAASGADLRKGHRHL